jgi:hypothetical protein
MTYSLTGPERLLAWFLGIGTKNVAIEMSALNSCPGGVWQ